jgi:hypothetical protein
VRSTSTAEEGFDEVLGVEGGDVVEGLAGAYEQDR